MIWCFMQEKKNPKESLSVFSNVTEYKVNVKLYFYMLAMQLEIKINILFAMFAITLKKLEILIKSNKLCKRFVQ